jgi:tRNA dimethylallyltransferase
MRIFSSLKRPFSTTAGLSSSSPVVVIAGPTCVGKSDVGLHLAESMNGEIISIDSRQAYKGMKIGANYPTVSMMERVPHWLVDFLPIGVECSAPEYGAKVRDKINDILGRGRTPIVVGGASFYVQSLLEGGPPAIPGNSSAASKLLRLERINRLDRHEWARLIDSYELSSPERATLDALLQCNQIDRLARAIEILENTGEFRPKWEHLRDITKDHEKLDYDFRCFFLFRNRMQLYRLIDYRCELMLRSGFLNEVRELERQVSLRRKQVWTLFPHRP